LGIASGHENCLCEQYQPDFKDTGIRYTGTVFRCKKCCRFVDGKKWKGGVTHFGNRTRILKSFQCPCCGTSMTSHRRAKLKMVKSMEKQLKNPELLQPHVKKQLIKKTKILKNFHLYPLH